MVPNPERQMSVDSELHAIGHPLRSAQAVWPAKGIDMVIQLEGQFENKKYHQLGIHSVWSTWRKLFRDISKSTLNLQILEAWSPHVHDACFLQ